MAVTSPVAEYRLLDHKGRQIKFCPPWLVRSLVDEPHSYESIATLDAWHRGRVGMRCLCDAVWHVVQRAFPHLQRNPGQEYRSRKECLLCERKPRRTARSGRHASDDRPVVGLILCTPNHNAQGAGAMVRDQPNPNPTATFQRILERAGFTSLERPLSSNDLYHKVKDVFAEIEVPAFEPGHRATVADFAWMPGGIYKGGLTGLNERMIRDWPMGKYKPEGWVFAIVDSVHRMRDVCRVEIPRLAPRMEALLRRRGERIGQPYRFFIQGHKTTNVRCPGPYLALLVCSANEVDAPSDAKPIAHRLLLQPIVTQSYPIPVESQHERDVALLLQRRSVPFLKPLFPDADGFRPDFILTTHRIVVEVQGMRLEEYHRTKEEVHRRMMDSPRYASYRLLTYRPCDSQSLASFERDLLQAVNGTRSVGVRGYGSSGSASLSAVPVEGDAELREDSPWANGRSL